MTLVLKFIEKFFNRFDISANFDWYNCMRWLISESHVLGSSYLITEPRYLNSTTFFRIIPFRVTIHWEYSVLQLIIVVSVFETFIAKPNFKKRLSRFSAAFWRSSRELTKRTRLSAYPNHSCSLRVALLSLVNNFILIR